MIYIRCILGKVQSPSAYVTVDTENAVPNSTRWIFDVEQEGLEQFSVELLDNKTGLPKVSGVVSPGICPLNEDAGFACIYVLDPELPVLRFAAEFSGVIHYRVTLDTVHTLGR